MDTLFFVCIAVAWVVFRVYWLVSARKTKLKPSAINKSQGSSLRMFVVLVMLALLILGFFFTPSSVIHNPTLRVFGIVLMLFGFDFATWAKNYMGSNWSMPTGKIEGGELITTGPFRYIRHPIYSGIWLAMVGTALATNWHLLAVPLAYGVEFVYYAHLEERDLTRKHPAAYPAYQAKSKMILPFIW